MRGVVAPLMMGMVLACGCRVAPPAAPAPTSRPVVWDPDRNLAPAEYIEDLRAVCSPPAGWKPQQLRGSAHYSHLVWLSPTGRTAYGVIRFTLPFPVGHDPVLWFMLREMRRVEGWANLLQKEWDANLRGVRFVTEGGLYTVRSNLMLRGFQGWVVYAGTLARQPLLPEELAQAELAREHTRIGAKP